MAIHCAREIFAGLHKVDICANCWGVGALGMQVASDEHPTPTAALDVTAAGAIASACPLSRYYLQVTRQQHMHSLGAGTPAPPTKRVHSERVAGALCGCGFAGTRARGHGGHGGHGGNEAE